MFTKSVPYTYWGEAVFIATYLINKLSSKVLKFQTPLNILLENVPHHTRILNSLPPKIFGYTAFIHQNQPQLKLDPKALKCIFIGYSPTQQGYKCYHPPTRKFIITCDVSFIEHQSYFQNNPIEVDYNCNPVSLIPTLLPILLPHTVDGSGSDISTLHHQGGEKESTIVPAAD